VGLAANGRHDHANLCSLTEGIELLGDSIARPGADSQNRLEESNEEAWQRPRRLRDDARTVAWGQGLATEGARAALAYGFEAVGLERIISTARADNAASRRVMDKCGLVFQKEFTHKRALVARYAINRAAWPASQAAAS
jgi:hypothetical protein